MKGDKQPKLTAKQRLLIKGIADGKTQRAAAKGAGMSEQHACECLKKPEVLETIQHLMAKHGLDDATLLTKHSELLGACKTVSTVSGKDAGADSVDFVDVPDWQARAKGLEMAYKLKGSFAPEKREVNVNVSTLTDEELVSLAESAD